MTTPPPQGQNPFAQGQNPYGQPQDGNPYGQQPQGYPAGQQQPGVPPQQQWGAPVPPQPSGRSKFKIIKNIAIVVVGIVVIGGGWLASRDDAQAAEVGDCMSLGNPDKASDPDLEVVKCGDAKAQYKVVQKKDGATAGCDRTKYSEYTQSGDGDSFTLCLEELTK